MTKVEALSDDAAQRLESLFAAEMEGRFTRITSKRAAAKLIADGLIEERVVQRRDGLGAYGFAVHALTQRGHMLYCEWASKQQDSEAA